jgi:hypothetical protein
MLKMAAVLTLAAAVVQGELVKTADIARHVTPAVVLIKTAGPSGEKAGSGFIVDQSGTIVTNLHVIEGAASIAVKLANGDIYDQVKIRAFDVRRDLAVMQIPGFGLPVVEVGNSDLVEPGQPVLLIGNPLGVLEGSVSAGIVSGVRSLEGNGLRIIQTDAAANPGSSGGPLLNATGKAVGVLSFKLSGGESLNFVIPINYVKGLLSATESFGLDELAKRLSTASNDLFTVTKPQFPSRWKSLSTGSTKLVRVEADHVYAETEIPDDKKRFGIFYIADLAKAGSKYIGTIRSGGTCTYTTWLNEQKSNYCRFEHPFEIALLTPSRIEGTTIEFPVGTKFDCARCQYAQKPQPMHFVWIPE